MCAHSYLLERRPDEKDYNTWENVESLPMNGGVAIADAEIERGLARARALAANYALAYPERALQLVITRYTCCGPEESERPFAVAATSASESETQRLAQEVVRLRAALVVYAREAAWAPRINFDGGELRYEMRLSPHAAQEALGQAQTERSN